MGKLTALGITSGIGSMLIGAKQAGFKPIGNIEWRRYYHKKDKDGKNTFLEYFPGAFMVESIDDLVEEEVDALVGVDLAMGHPECGKYSMMNNVNKGRLEAMTDPGDIPLFVELLARLKPRYFAMDDLPVSLVRAYPMSRYQELLPEYDLFPEWVSNYHYGNPQKNRKRFFMLGSLKSEGFVFRPGEVEGDYTVAEALKGLTRKVPNSNPHTLELASDRGLHMDYYGHRPTWGEVQAWFKKKSSGAGFRYHGPNGFKVKPGMYKSRWDGHSYVLDGGSPTINPRTNLPFTIRERARIQGFPDDFVFYGTRLIDGKWKHESNIDMVKQTGKAMPIQFNRFFAKQVRAHIEGKKFKCSGQRYLTPNPHIDMAKQWFCEHVGYADQPEACLRCWLYDTCNLPRCDKQVPIDFNYPEKKK